MSLLDLPYLPGTAQVVSGPLGRYLPPIPPGIAARWLAENIEPGGWVLDPFGASPSLAVEAARAGYRVLVASNNPITRFMLEVMTCAPREEDFQAALADLAASRKGDERLERHIQALYETECNRCGRTISAQAFLWERHPQTPYARVYTCPYCDDSGERPLTAADTQRLSGLPPAGLHRARALERVASIDDPSRPEVEAALNCYLPRSLYVIFTLINRLDFLPAQDSKRGLLTALLLNALDEGNSLWQYPSGRLRPRQLVISPHFRENNLWFSLEQAAASWADYGPPIPQSIWPELPPAGGICLFQGRFRDLIEQLSDVPIRAVLTAFPRPNQAFWTLSALWTGWLWGREAVAPIKSVLNRKRYDWNWQTSALQVTLGKLPSILAAGTPFFGLLAELEPAFFSAVLLAAGTSGFDLQGMAVRSDDNLAQVLWHPGSASAPTHLAPAGVVCRSAVQNSLTERGEPAPFLPLVCAATAALVKEHSFAFPPQQDAPDLFSQMQACLRRTFTDKAFLIHYGGNDQSLDTGLWWLRDPGELGESLVDRVEIETVRYLQKNPGCTFQELDRHLCLKLPGLLTPSMNMVRICLESYGTQEPAGSGRWQIRAPDRPAARRQEINSMHTLLHEVGARLGYSVEGETPILWKAADGTQAAVIYVQASGLIGKVLFTSEYQPSQCLLVLPGGRANLVSYKINRDPRLSQAVNAGWRFIKYRQLRELAEELFLDRQAWEAKIRSDPLEYRSIQLDLP